MLILLGICAVGLSLDSKHATDASADERAIAALQQMTVDEKIGLLTGTRGFYIRSVLHVGFPELKMSDGPVGVRNYGPTTAYPAGVCLASTFDPDLAQQFGVGIGRDARSRGVHIWLGPGVNLSRIPQNGRDFEYYGEDPILAARTVAPVVRGVQSQGVVATVKHYAANNHENDRMVDNSNVDERVLRELYLKPFEAAVREGGAWAVMCAYNKVNGLYCSENPHLLTDILKHDWGFKGVLMSDWGAVHSTLPALKAGLDLEMPGGEFITEEKVKPLVDSGQISTEEINNKAYRILRMAYNMGFPDRTQEDTTIPKDDPANEQVALQIAREGTVLLTNRNHTLPLDAKRVKHILVVGPNAQPAVTGGGGSAYTTPAEAVSIVDALKKVGGPDVQVEYRPFFDDLVNKAFNFRGFRMPDGSGRSGLQAERFANMDLSGTPTSTERSRGINMVLRTAGTEPVPSHFSMRWTGTVQFPESGTYMAVARSDDGMRVYLDDKAIIDDWSDHGETPDSATITVEKDHPYHLKVEYYQNEGDAIAQFGFVPVSGTVDKDLPTKEIASADVVVAAVGFNPATESEGLDRTFEMPAQQDKFLQQLVALNPRTIVLNNSGAAVDMSHWIDRAGAVLQEWYPGGIGNIAVAEILFGVTNPSGKLAATFPKTLKGTYYETAYPPKNHNIDYTEGLFIGYRWFDKNNVEPQFPFGFGLSYTTFHLGHLRVQTDVPNQVANLVVNVHNEGNRDGAEVVQAYVHKEQSSVVRAVKELKGFTRVFLKAGESKDVTIQVRISDLAYYEGKDPKQPWKLENGRYDVLVGTSSRDLPLRGWLDLGAPAH